MSASDKPSQIDLVPINIRRYVPASGSPNLPATSIDRKAAQPRALSVVHSSEHHTAQLGAMLPHCVRAALFRHGQRALVIAAKNDPTRVCSAGVTSESIARYRSLVRWVMVRPAGLLRR